MINANELRSLIGRISLFWKVLVLVLVVAGIPLSIAVSTSLTAAITTAERLVSTNILQLGDRIAERLEYTLVVWKGMWRSFGRFGIPKAYWHLPWGSEGSCTAGKGEPGTFFRTEVSGSRLVSS